MGLSAVWGRARGLTERPFEISSLRRAFTADNWWGVAAALWIATGLWRLLAGTEKATSYYLQDVAFRTKMALFLLVFLLEIWPMVTLIRWRGALRKKGTEWRPDPTTARRLGLISYVEVALLVAIVAAAVAMARGYGFHPTR
jgi:putative membrane protein